MNGQSFFLSPRTFCLAATTVILCAVLVGCESGDGTESPVHVTPESVTLNRAGSTNVILTASGGLAPYRWTVSDATLGRVNASRETAVYTRTALNGINLVTATDTNGFVGRATIYQSVNSGSGSTASSVHVTPAAVVLSAGGATNVMLQASGGPAPYTWTVSDSTLGRVNASGDMAIYTRTAAAGINLVTATAASRVTGRATIYQNVNP